MTRLETSVSCILVACDRALARGGNPLLSNLQAQDRLRALGFTISRGRRILGDARRGGYEALYTHPCLGFSVAYVVEELANGTFWRLERRPLPPRRPSVFRYDYKLGAHAPSIGDAEALALVPAGDDAYVVRFHSDVPLRDARLAPVEDCWGDPVSPIVEPREAVPAYGTERWGLVRGYLYVLPCRSAGRRDGAGRPVFADAHGEFVLAGEGGMPEMPARFWLESPAATD